MDPHLLDSLFRKAVSAIDAGDLAALERQLADHPELVHDRLDPAGTWLRDKVGAALDGFFHKPYLLWFVAEDPVRNGKLPGNIPQITQAIIRAAKHEAVPSLREQLDYCLRLVSWSVIARECGVQIPLIDALVDAGASPEGNPNNALVNGNLAAAEHLLARGASLTLATALCLGRWEDVSRLGATAEPGQKQFGFVLAALNGKPEALRRMLALGVDLNAPSQELYSHGTPLHHAVWSGSLEAVQVLVDAGASLASQDTAWNGTPLGWAIYGEQQGTEKSRQYAEIGAYLREIGLRHGDGKSRGTD